MCCLRMSHSAPHDVGRAGHMIAQYFIGRNNSSQRSKENEPEDQALLGFLTNKECANTGQVRVL